MAYGDYIHCASCDCKLLYDGSRAGRDRLDDAYAEGQWEILCPPCLNTLRAKVAELEADAERYRLLRQKVCIISKGENAEFQIINLRPFYIAPRPDIELDAVLDAVMAQESK